MTKLHISQKEQTVYCNCKRQFILMS